MLDKIISTKIAVLQTIPLTKLMIFITTLGDKYIISFLSLVILPLLIFKHKHYLKAKIFSLSLILGVIFSQGIKYLIQRPRPLIALIEKEGFSFPSGHATLSTIFFGMLIYLFQKEIKNKTLRLLFIISNILLIILISFSRIYLNVHWLTDVLAGIIIGLICISTSIKIMNKK